MSDYEQRKQLFMFAAGMPMEVFSVLNGFSKNATTEQMKNTRPFKRVGNRRPAA